MCHPAGSCLVAMAMLVTIAPLSAARQRHVCFKLPLHCLFLKLIRAVTLRLYVKRYMYKQTAVPGHVQDLASSVHPYNTLYEYIMSTKVCQGKIVVYEMIWIYNICLFQTQRNCQWVSRGIDKSAIRVLLKWHIPKVARAWRFMDFWVT